MILCYHLQVCIFDFLEIHKASQKWYLRSDEEQEIEEWFKALHKAVVSYDNVMN